MASIDKAALVLAKKMESQVTAHTAQLADTVKKVNGVTPVNGNVTIPVPEVDTSKLATKTEVNAVASGSPKGTYVTLAALQSAFPTGNSNMYVVTADGKWYYWNGTAWTAGGVYQSTGIADNSVVHTNILSDDKTVNILNKSSATLGSYKYAAVGQPVGTSSSSSWYGVLTPIPVNVGDVVRFNHAYMNTYFVGVDNAGNVVQIGANKSPEGAVSITVATGVTGFYTTVFKDYIDTAMITINNTMPSGYLPSRLKKSLDWLDYKPKSITPTHLSDEVKNLIGPASKWVGKTFVSLGDSITWQDGKVYASTSNIARGYQTILKEKLGFASYNNQGVNGRPIANGSANGVGTNTTGKGLTYSAYDLVIIAGGTNDFKLNIPLGVKGVIGDTIFDTNTFYGAYRDLVEYILTNKPTIRIVLFTPLQRDNGGYDINTTNPAGHKLIDYVNAILAIGEMYGIPVCDMHRNSGFNKLLLSTYTLDGLHPNDVGYARIGDYASSFVNQV
ncbi:SGNH/GDSL hydrolase family protein [Peribacillus frigoritolerans]|uniref:SGNH/GDSL hydrolase family protein n=1 Tax=Peribacillus castrilensis TaxID=2897690 RepID=UPI003D29E1C0